MHSLTRNTYIDFLKALAIFFMVLDHIAYYFLPLDLPSTVFIRGFGRIAMPLFFITHGYLLAHRNATLTLNRLQLRIGYFIIIGAFLTGILRALNQPFMLNILIQFAYVETCWFLTLKRHVLLRISLVFMAACYLACSDLFINWLFTDELYYIYYSIEYGSFPLFYSVAGSILGYAPRSKFFQILAALTLVTTVSFQYNIFILAVLTFIADWSFASWLLTSLSLPILFWYISLSTANFQIASPAITFVSRHAFAVYVLHLQLILIILAIQTYA